MPYPFSRYWRLPDLRYRILLKRLSGKSRNCDSKTVLKTSCPSTDDPCSPHPPSQTQDPPCFSPKPPTCHRDVDSRKLVFWQMLSLYVAIPTVLVMSIITFLRLKEKAKRPREPFLDVPYMYRRTKPFPWGDGNHTLFHNPVTNAVPPHGYEVEDPNAMGHKKTNN